MIEKMTRYDFLLLSGETEKFLRDLQELGLVDITRSARPIDAESAEMLSRAEGLRKRISDIEGENFLADEKYASLSESIQALEKQLPEREPWGDFDLKALDDLSQFGQTVRFHKLPKKKFDEAWGEECVLEVAKDDGSTIWFVTVAPAGSEPDIPAVAAPKGTISEAREAIKELTRELEARKAELLSEKDLLPSLRAEYASATASLDLYLTGAAKESAAEETLDVFTGFAPKENEESLKAAFDRMDVFYLSSDANVDDNPPIRLKNNRFVGMFEVLTDMYGRPVYNSFDPTPFISIFFLLFFAMCMGDAGYGLILIIVGLLLRKAKGFASLAPLVVTLGIGTLVVGFFFHTFFSMDFATWECFPEGLRKVMLPSKIAGYDGSMVLALVVGILHLLLAMIVKTVYATKNSGFLNSLATWGWTVFWVGLTAIGVVALTGVLDKEVTKWAIIILGIVCAIGIFPLNNIHRNPLINIGSGLWDTYNMATGILGDVLSYLRLYALGLAGAMLGFAFNDLGKMALGDGGFRWIPFILIVVIGHTLNVAMAALGAFVHPLRLNFLEFFKNSDYDGTGRKYNPLKK